MRDPRACHQKAWPKLDQRVHGAARSRQGLGRTACQLEGATSCCLITSTVRRTAAKTGRLAGARGVSGAIAASIEPATTAFGALLSAHFAETGTQ